MRRVVRGALLLALALAVAPAEGRAQDALWELTPAHRVRVAGPLLETGGEGTFVRLDGVDLTLRADDGSERAFALDTTAIVSVLIPERRIAGAAKGAVAGAGLGGLFLGLMRHACPGESLCPGSGSVGEAGVVGVALLATIGGLIATSMSGEHWRVIYRAGDDRR